MTELTILEKREFFSKDLLKIWGESEASWGKKLWTTVTKIMVFVGNYKDFSGADKKKEALEILKLILAETDAPGPDFLVDRFILWAVEYGIDALYDAAKGQFNFDGDE